MSDLDLRNLYESVRRGEEYVAPKRESELYRSILSEAQEFKTACPTGDGTRIAFDADPNDCDATKTIVRVPGGGEVCVDCDPESENTLWCGTRGAWYCVPKNIYSLHSREAGSDIPTMYESIKHYIKMKGYVDGSLSPKHLSGLYNSLTVDLSPEDVEAWFEFIRRKDKPRINTPENRKGYFQDLLQQFNFSEELIHQLIDQPWTDRGGSNVGPGEVALSLIFDDVKNTDAGQSGDLRLAIDGIFTPIAVSDDDIDENGKKEYLVKDAALEVKGQGGHFGQQGGRGGPKLAFGKILDSIIDDVNKTAGRDGSNWNNKLFKRYKQVIKGTINIVELLDIGYRLVADSFPTYIDTFINNAQQALMPIYKHAAEKGAIQEYLTLDVFKKQLTSSTKMFDTITSKLLDGEFKPAGASNKKAIQQALDIRQQTQDIEKFYGTGSSAQDKAQKEEFGAHTSPIKAAILKINAFDYLDHHNYHNVLFIDKEIQAYVLFTQADVLTEGGLIDQGIFNTESVNPINGYTVNALYPSLRYKFQ